MTSTAFSTKLGLYDARRMLYCCRHPMRYKRLQRQRHLITGDGYTYNVFDENKCIFVHVPKTAGISISMALFGNKSGGHTTIDQYQIIFPRHEFCSYFKFGFVRNPWDRLLSAYMFLRNGGMTEKDKSWAANELHSYKDFSDFVLHGLKKQQVQNWRHFQPQHEFLCDKRSKKVLVDFVGRYENLESDYAHVRRLLNINRTNPLYHLNQTEKANKPDYRKYYTDNTVDIVKNVYASDIEIFGYEFDKPA